MKMTKLTLAAVAALCHQCCRGPDEVRQADASGDGWLMPPNLPPAV